MMCAWNELLSILPQWLARELDKHSETLLELRLRLGMPPQLIHKHTVQWLTRTVCSDDLNFCINTASRYSPWTAQTAALGYITARGGHRIGLCGSAVMRGGVMTGIQTVRSLCIRIARDIPGIAQPYRNRTGSFLIIGPPGSGKTTLLRDLARQLSQKETVAVVDERCELFPEGFLTGCSSLDVLYGCPKTIGIQMLLRTMGPQTIAADEITAPEDCEALLHACRCGVRLVASAHATGLEDLYKRQLYKPLIAEKYFENILIMGRDQSVHEERMIP